MAINRFHKTVFALTAVIAPLYWLTMTEDGQRRVDSVMLWLAGKPGIEVNLKALDHQLSPDDLAKVYPDIDWHCVDQASPFGQQLCSAQIGTFNGLPARRITFFFAHGQASALKLAYRGIYHDPLIRQLVQQFGQPAQGGADSTVLQWSQADGVVIVKHRLLEGDEAAMMWIAGPPGAG